MRDRQYFVYILTNKVQSVFYTGVTNDLKRRIWEHKQKLVPGFTAKYNITRLVYYEVTSEIVSAIEREKQIKDYRREKKVALIAQMNPAWKDLGEEL